tara:strand:- start:287 stop:463 length:177 start_codon:yes stop_codon:yes gene_type:complete
MKVYITEFKIGTKVYDGPFIYANTFEEADIEATAYGVVIIGEAIIVDQEKEEWNRVLH